MDNEWIEIKYPNFEGTQYTTELYFRLYFKELVEFMIEDNEKLPPISETFCEHMVIVRCHNRKLNTITERETYFLSINEMIYVLYKWNITHFKLKKNEEN